MRMGRLLTGQGNSLSPGQLASPLPKTKTAVPRAPTGTRITAILNANNNSPIVVQISDQVLQHTCSCSGTCGGRCTGCWANVHRHACRIPNRSVCSSSTTSQRSVIGGFWVFSGFVITASLDITASALTIAQVLYSETYPPLGFILDRRQSPPIRSVSSEKKHARAPSPGVSINLPHGRHAACRPCDFTRLSCLSPTTSCLRSSGTASGRRRGSPAQSRR
jgi:hypothetical protein